jgi:dihydrolipoamide dehydrogenase
LRLKTYDVIAIGTGSAMNLVDPIVQRDPSVRVAVIDKDEPGGICLTRGCIPSKILLYPAELVRTVQHAKAFGLDVAVNAIDFRQVMDRMRTLITRDIDQIRRGLQHTENIDYYPTAAEFVAPYTLSVGRDTIKAAKILLSTGSRPLIPPITNLESVGYLTSDTLLQIDRLPESTVIVGGGYIAAELGHFLAAMGSRVTILGRNPQFVKQEEPEVSALAVRELGRHMTILTNHEVVEAAKAPDGRKALIAVNRGTGERLEVEGDELLVAAGRVSNADILHPENGGIETDRRGWIQVNEYLETSQPNIWAFGDANGRYLFKHAANYESRIVYYNAVLGQQVKVDYHAIPHAVFTYPEIGSVGLREHEAVTKYGKAHLRIGFHRYRDTAKGEAMGVDDGFVKVIVEQENMKIVGAHIIGPFASMLIQEIVNLMYTPERSATPIVFGMHIHPALNEVVERAFTSLMPVDHYHHALYPGAH